MALIKYSVTLVAKQDAPYNVLPDTDVSIRKASDDTLVQIYSDEDGLNPIAQPGAKTDSRGVFEFYTDSLPVVKAEWSDGVNIYSEIFNGNSLQSISGLTDPSDLDGVYAREFNSISEMQAFTGHSVGNVVRVVDLLVVTNYEITSGSGDVPLGGGLFASKITSEANDLSFNSGAFWSNKVNDTQTLIDIKNFQGQGGAQPEQIPVIVHDYTDGNRSLQLDKVGGNAAQYVLGLRRGNNAVNRPDQDPEYVAGCGFLECSTDVFTGGSKLVNKVFYIDPDGNLFWTGNNGTPVSSAQFVNIKPDGDGRFPFVFTATQEQDLFMELTNSSGSLLQIRDDVAGTRTRLIADSNQTSGMRIECLAGPMSLSSGTVIQASKSIQNSEPQRLAVYAVATVPAASSWNQHVIFVTDGNSGQPCLAVSDGVNWNRIALGSPISSS